MVFSILKLKIMPTAPGIDLKAVESEVRKRLEKFGAKIHSTEQEPIAFGLVALIATVAWPEEKSADDAVEDLMHIEDVSSIEIIDYRRAFG